MLANLPRYPLSAFEPHMSVHQPDTATVSTTTILPASPLNGTGQSIAMTAMNRQLQKLRQTEVCVNNAINKHSFIIGHLVEQGLVGREEAKQAIHQAAVDVGYVARDGDRQTCSTIDSGLTAGAKASTQSMPIVPFPEPMRLAEHFLSYGQTGPIRRWRGQFYIHTGTHYRVWSDDEQDACLYRHLDAVSTFDKDGKCRKLVANGSLVREVRNALPSLAHVLVPDDGDQPSWLDGVDGPSPDELIVFQNGILHLPTGQLLPHSDAFFSTNALGYDFIADAPSPKEFLAFVNELWPEDPQSIEALQEWMGYCLTSDTTLQKILLVVGPPRSGKGTLARLMTQLLGPYNCCGPTLAGLGTNFGLWPLIDKQVAIVSDARWSGKGDNAVVVERLLAISGEDTLTVDRKHLAPWTGKLPTRFMILTNELPRLAEASGALANRFIILGLTNSWLGKEDPGLTKRLLAELPSIMLWAIEGWRRLRERGYFVQPKASLQLMESLTELTSPITAFVRECCCIGPEFSCDVDQAYNAWCEWCMAHGQKNTGTTATLGKDLRAVVPGLETRQPREGGERRREWVGIGLIKDMVTKYKLPY